MDLSIKPRVKYMNLREVHVDPDYRRNGLSSDLFKKALSIGRSNKKAIINGNEIVSSAQINIRSKHNSFFSFTKSGTGRVSKISAEKAKSVIYGNKNANYTGSVSATTVIPEKKGFKRIRIRGRWLTIKRRK